MRDTNMTDTNMTETETETISISTHTHKKDKAETKAEAVEAPKTTFADLGLTCDMLKGVEAAGFEHPSEIQVSAIPAVLAGKDLIGQAQTGSGKTGAFALPTLQKLKFDGTVEILVLVPTRELAQQVVVEYQRLGKFKKVSVVTVVGGQNAYHQIKDVNRGAQIIVATPGRMLDHLSSGRLENCTPKMLILDEADEMLDMGFIEDIKKIISFLPKERQTLLFSATMPPPIARLAKQEMTDPEHIKLTDSKQSHADIEQLLYVMRDKDRIEAFSRIVETEHPDKSIVFCRTRRDTDELCQRLIARGHNAKALHGDLRQEARTHAINEFRKGSVKILIATDVASRGLDIDNISHVFNFHLPENKDRYTHRIGRTGRAGNKGKAITFSTLLELKTSVFFRAHPPSQFKMSSVPTISEVNSLHMQKMLDAVSNTEVTESDLELANLLAENNEPFDLLCHFIAHLQAGSTVSGPDQIGLKADEVQEAFKNDRSSGRSGGGYRGRSSGGGGYRGRNDSNGGSRGGSDRRGGSRSNDERSGGRPSGGNGSSGGYRGRSNDEPRSYEGRPKGGHKPAGAGAGNGGRPKKTRSNDSSAQKRA